MGLLPPQGARWQNNSGQGSQAWHQEPIRSPPNLSLAKFGRKLPNCRNPSSGLHLGALVISVLLSFVPLPARYPSFWLISISDPWRRSRHFQHISGVRRADEPDCLGRYALLLPLLSWFSCARCRRPCCGLKRRRVWPQETSIPICRYWHRWLTAVQGYFIAVGLESFASNRVCSGRSTRAICSAFGRRVISLVGRNVFPDVAG